MRSLAAKLTLAFLLVGIIGAVVVAMLVRQRTQNEFGRLILNQNQQMLINSLSVYYKEFGTWEGVERIFRPGNEVFPLGREPGARWDARRVLFTIADAEGVIVFGGGPDDLGRVLPGKDLRNGVRIVVDGENIGWLLFTPQIDRWMPGTLEGDFLLNINQAILISAGMATAIALVIGGVLAYTMTRSLRELTAATHELADGKLGYQVKVRSKDEFGVLADSFNQMSRALEHSTDLRKRMTADIAHDLRTPLSVIMGYTEALSDGKLTASPEIYSVMHAEALHLSHLIDDLKTMSLADAGELPLTMQYVSPQVLVKRTADSYRVQAEEVEITVISKIVGQLPEIRVDVERMMQVLGNLMTNAIRYTPNGGEIQLLAEQDSSGVLIQVADNGAGIPAEELPLIFERSFRGDQARGLSEGETGLGLSIAKSLVEAQGGTLTVTSDVGRGTTFKIFIPVNE
jgi:two-component system sensor histidine kinase BaeS